MVSKGLNYISKTTIRRALKFVFGTWIIAMLNYGMCFFCQLFDFKNFILINNRSSYTIMGLVTW